MTTIKQIAQDPRNALRELEIRLGAEPGDLLKDMERLSPPGEEWGKHLPYRMATSYYDDEKAQTLYQPHVDECDYCKTLLETLHPTSLDATEFASKAKRMHADTRREWTAQIAPYALAASIVMVVLGGGSFLRSESLESEVKELRASVDAARADAMVAFADPIPTVTTAAARGWVSDVMIGSGADATTVVTAAMAEPTFPAGQPVRLVTEIQNAPSRTPISVVWVGPDNQKVHEEISWTQVGEKTLAFTAPNTAAWKSGEYRAELWVADKKVRQAQFDITPAEQTEQNPLVPDLR
jgi:hypothetical protein